MILDSRELRLNAIEVAAAINAFEAAHNDGMTVSQLAIHMNTSDARVRFAVRWLMRGGYVSASALKPLVLRVVRMDDSYRQPTVKVIDPHGRAHSVLDFSGDIQVLERNGWRRESAL